MKFLITLMVSSLLAFSAFADETKICVITADIDPNVGTLSVEVAGGKAHSLRVISSLDQRILADDSYAIENLMGREGIVATERSGYNIVVLRLENFDPARGGTVMVDYLVNAITGKRRNLRLKFMKEGSTFVLRTSEGHPVNHIHFVGNKIFKKVVGLKSIEASFR